MPACFLSQRELYHRFIRRYSCGYAGRSPPRLAQSTQHHAFEKGGRSSSGKGLSLKLFWVGSSFWLVSGLPSSFCTLKLSFRSCILWRYRNWYGSSLEKLKRKGQFLPFTAMVFYIIVQSRWLWFSMISFRNWMCSDLTFLNYTAFMFLL